MAQPPADNPKPELGDLCTKCGKGRYKVCNTELINGGKVRRRYFHCPKCRYRPEENKSVIPPKFSGFPYHSIREYLTGRKPNAIATG